jgi:hypothetical protein
MEYSNFLRESSQGELKHTRRGVAYEDLRDWFGKGKEGGVGGGGWDRYNTKGERIGKCAREPGEAKPKCLSKEKAAKMSKQEIASAVRRKRKQDPVADRPGKGGEPKMVSNKIDEQSQKEYEKFDRRVNAAMSTKNPQTKIKMLKSASSLHPSSQVKLADEYAGEKRFCQLCNKEEARSECSFGPKLWDKFSIATVHPTNEEYTEDNLFVDLSNLCFEQNLFDANETYYFVEQLIQQDLVYDFLEDLSETLNVDVSEYLAEGLSNVVRGVKGGYQAARGIINALSQSGRAKAGVKAGTALGKKPESVVKGAAASTTVRSARRAARSANQAKPEVANRYLQALQSKRAARGLPAAGQSSAGSPKAVAQRAQAKPAKTQLSSQGQDAKTWQKYQKSAQTEVDKTRQAPKPAWEKPKASSKPSSGLTKTVRATGNTGPYPGLEKYKPTSTPASKTRKGGAATAAAGTATSVSKPKNQGSQPAKASTSSVDKYNTKDPSGQVRSRLKVGPKKVGTGSVAGDFDQAFKSARTSGKKEFEFKGKKYTTKLAEDHKEVASGKKVDDEGYMARTELDKIEKAVKELRGTIKSPKMQLPAWVQSKITKAVDYLDTAADYLQTDEMSEERGPCWKGYKQEGMKKKGGKLVPNCVPESIEERFERINVTGKTYLVMFVFRGKPGSIQFFFPTSKRPTRDEVQAQLVKVYPDANLVNFVEREREPNSPIIQVEGAITFNKFMEQMMPPIDPQRHKEAQKRQKLYNKGTSTDNPYEKETFLKRTGPQLPLASRRSMSTQMASYEPTGETISEREFDEPGEPRGTQRQKVDPAAWKKSLEQWKKLQPEIFDRKPGSGKGLPSAKKDTKKTTQVAHFEPEGNLVDEQKADQPDPKYGYKIGSKVGDDPKTTAAIKKVQQQKQLKKNLETVGDRLKKKPFTEDWQKVNRQDKTDGLSPEAVKAYRRENPGSKLQTAVTEKKPTGKRAERRKSFCRRMKGMKSKLTSAQTARDPDSRINKALRRWNCN